MDSIGQFESSKEAVPRYNKIGQLYTEEQRRQIADRRGVCVNCGITTHEKARILGKKPISNENVYEGICIRCNPRKVPQYIYDAWDAKNRPQMTATVTAVHPSTSENTTRSRPFDSQHRMPSKSSGHARSSSTDSAPLAHSPKRPTTGNTKQSMSSLATSSQSHGLQRSRQPQQMHKSVTITSPVKGSTASQSSSKKQAQFQAMGSSSFPPRGQQFPGDSADSQSFGESQRLQNGSGHYSSSMNSNRKAQERSGSGSSNHGGDFFDNSLVRGVDALNIGERSAQGRAPVSLGMHAVPDSQRSIPSTLTNSSRSNESANSAVLNEKAALGIKKLPPATAPGVQSFNRNNSAYESSDSIISAGETTKTPFENEKAALGIFRPSAPATRPGVESYSSAASFTDTSEPSSMVKTSTSYDSKASYRNSPASKPGVQSAVSRGIAPARSDQSLRGSRSEDDWNDSGDLNFKNSSHMSVSSDLKLSLQDDYKGDEYKQPTHEYMKQLADSLDENDPIQIRRVLHNLRNVEDDDQNEVLHQMIKTILSHYGTVPRVGDVAVGVLWRTAAVSVEAKAEVMGSGVIDVVLDCLRKKGEDSEFSQWVLGLLTCVAFHYENKELIGTKGGIELVLDVLSQHKKSAGVFEWGCRCLHNLVHCFENDEGNMERTALAKNITSIEEAGGIEIVIDAMSKNITENNAQLWAVKLLWRLMDASGNTDSSRRVSVMHRMVVIRKMAAADFVSVASKLLRQQSTSDELLVYTAELMTVVILGASGESNMFKFAYLLEKASNCASNMIRAMKQMKNDLEVQAAGCRLLAALCNANGSVQGDMIEQGAMEVMAHAITKTPKNKSIVEPGTWAMWKFSAELKASDGNIQFDPDIVRYVLKILGTLALVYSERAILRAINGFTANVCGMTGLSFDDFPIADLSFGFFSDPHAGGGDCLSLLCSQYSECPVIVLRSLGLEKVVDILKHKPDVQDLIVPVLLAAAENSAEARTLMLSSGVLLGAVASLGSTLKKDLMMMLVDLISALFSERTKAMVLDENSTPSIPDGFCKTIRSCLESDFSDEASSIKIMQMAVGVIAQSAPSEELDLLLPWVTDKMGGQNLNVAINACNVLWAITAKGTIKNTARLQTLLASTLAFMLRYNGDNGHEFVMEAQTAAAGALSGVAACIRNAPISVEGQQIDSFMGVVYKARPRGEEASCFMSAILVSIWNLCFVHEDVLLQAGVIILVIDIMGAYRLDTIVQEKGCLVLAQLASSENIQITLSIVYTDGVQILLEALASFPSSKGVQSEAARALAHLSTDDETRMLVNAMGGINLLVASVTSFSGDLILLERTYSALLNLTSDVPEQFLDFPAIVRAIVTTMAVHPLSTSLRENGLGILQNVCMKGPLAKETIAEEGGITTVVNAMENFIITPTVLERSFSTLWSLAVLPANQSRIAEANGIEMVVMGMYASIEYERVQQQGCGCMFTLSLDPNNRQMIRNSGGVEAVVLAAKAHYGSIGVQLEVCKCLSGLATPSEGPDQIDQISQDEVNTVVFAMQRFIDVEGVQVAGSKALVNFLFARNAVSLLSANKNTMREAVERASDQFPTQCAEINSSFNQRIRELT